MRLTEYHEAREAFRCRDFRQALYDEGHVLMDDVIVNLHGAEHTARRRLENRLFRRDTFSFWEREVIPRTIEDVLRPYLQSQVAPITIDLITVARRTMMSLSAEIAGVDRPEETQEEFECLYDQMTRLSRASTVVHALGEKGSIIEDGNVALAEFDARFLRPSKARRQALLAQFERGEIGEDEVPRDVLTTLLANADQLALSDAIVRREIAYFPWVGSHSTSSEFVHAAHHMFEWSASRLGALDGLRDDPFELQRLVHESLRLHPASPVSLRHALATVQLSSGRVIEAGTTIVIDLVAANRDPAVFGDDAYQFRPGRPLPDSVSPWGLSFGTGFHACVGAELAGGLPAEPAATADTHLFGAIVAMLRILLGHGARPHPDDPPTRDAHSQRANWGRYPVVLHPPDSAAR